MTPLEDFLRQHRPVAPPPDPALAQRIIASLPPRRSPKRLWWLAIAAFCVAAGSWRVQTAQVAAEQQELTAFTLAIWETDLGRVEGIYSTD